MSETTPSQVLRSQFVLVTFAVNLTQWLVTVPENQIVLALESAGRQWSESARADGRVGDTPAQGSLRELIAFKHAANLPRQMPPARVLAHLLGAVCPALCCLELHVQDGELYLSIRHDPIVYLNDCDSLQKVFGAEWTKVCRLRLQETLYHGQWVESHIAVPLRHNEIYARTMKTIDDANAQIEAGARSPRSFAPLPIRLITGTGINIEAWAQETNLSSTSVEFPDDVIAESIEYLQEDIPDIFRLYSINKINFSILFQGHKSTIHHEYTEGVFGILLEYHPNLNNLVVFVDDEGYGYILARPDHYDTDVALLGEMFPRYLIDKFAIVCDVDDYYHE